MKLASDEYIRMGEKARLGEQFEELKKSREFLLLKTYIFDPYDRAAFELFKKADAADPVQIIETQMTSKVIDKIQTDIEKIIQEGIYAREVLKQTIAEEDEEE